MPLGPRALDLPCLLEHFSFGKENQAVALRKIFQRLANFGKKFNGMILNRLGNTSDLPVQFRRHGNGAEALKGIDQRMGKALQAVSVLDDAFALHVIEDFADLFGRELVMIQEGNKARDGPLEVDVVLPERVVSVDEQRLRSGKCSWLMAHSP